MQLPLPADVLVPLAIGGIVAVMAAVVLVFGLRRKSDDASAPTHADWTGENVGGPAAPSGQAASTRTVADAIAARQADTDPFPAVPPPAVPDQRDETGRPADPTADGDPPLTPSAWALVDLPSAPAEVAAGREAASPRAGTGWRCARGRRGARGRPARGCHRGRRRQGARDWPWVRGRPWVWGRGGARVRCSPR